MLKKIGFVIPVANEETTITAFIDALMQELGQNHFVLYMIMDTYSRDKTRSIVKQRSREDPRVQLVWFPESTGSVSCRLKGFKHALMENCDLIVEMDSGFSHPPNKVNEMLAALKSDQVDVVFMSRFSAGGGVKNFPLYRRVISWGGSLLANLWLGTKFSDGTSGFQGFKSYVLKSLNLDKFLAVGGIYSTEIKYYCSHYRYVEIPFTYVGSTSNFRLKWVISAIMTLFLMRQNKKIVVANLGEGLRGNNS